MQVQWHRLTISGSGEFRIVGKLTEPSTCIPLLNFTKIGFSVLIIAKKKFSA